MLGDVAVLEGHTQVCHKVTFLHGQAHTGERSQRKWTEECKQSVSAGAFSESPQHNPMGEEWMRNEKGKAERKKVFYKVARGKHLGFFEFVHLFICLFV